MAMMIPMIPLTEMSGVPVYVGLYGVKMIQESTYEPHQDEKKIPAAKDGKTPASTQPVIAPTTPPPVAPVVCSTITFHDDKTIVVKETMAQIASMAGPVPHSV